MDNVFKKLLTSSKRKRLTLRVHIGTLLLSDVEQVQNARATPFVSNPYMCPITNDWMMDPVMTPSGHSYERSAIVEWLETDCCDSFTRKELKISKLVPNRNLRDATEHYRCNRLKFLVAYDV